MALTKIKPTSVAASTAGSVLYYNTAGNLTVMPPGSSGQLLRTNGVGADPSWSTVSNGIVSCRYNYQAASNITVGTDAVWLNMEVTMPAMKAGSRYKIEGWSSTDDTNSSTYGVGLLIWVRDNTTGNSYWVHRQSRHTIYDSVGTDHYELAHVEYVTNGTEWDGYSAGLVTGRSYTFRIYGRTNNGNGWFNTTNMSDRFGPAGGIVVYELDGASF